MHYVFMLSTNAFILVFAPDFSKAFGAYATYATLMDSDLCTESITLHFIKFADDTYIYLIVQALNYGSRVADVDEWAVKNDRNDLRLNCAFARNMISFDVGKRGHTAQILPPCGSIERVSRLLA